MQSNVVIDGLTHITSSGIWLDNKTDASTGALLRQMDDAGVRYAIVTALQRAVTNDVVLEACRAHPDRLIGFYAPEIAPTADLRSDLRRARDQGFHGIKLHPRFGQFDLATPEVLRVVDCAVEERMPVILCGIAGGPPGARALGRFVSRTSFHSGACGGTPGPRGARDGA
jgi:predicted TIM-barrel fold metal-dependent hydrolase